MLCFVLYYYVTLIFFPLLHERSKITKPEIILAHLIIKLFIFVAWWLLLLKCSWIQCLFQCFLFSVFCDLVLSFAYLLQYLGVLLDFVWVKGWWHRQTYFTTFSLCEATVESFFTELARFYSLCSISMLFSEWVGLKSGAGKYACIMFLQIRRLWNWYSLPGDSWSLCMKHKEYQFYFHQISLQ